MHDLSRRSALMGSTAVAAGVAAAFTGAPAGAAAANNEYIWAVNTSGVVVPSDTWVPIPWLQILLDTSPAYVDVNDRTKWIFPVATTSGIYQYLVNVAWDNAFGPSGARITPPTHRKLLRIVQQDIASPQINQAVYLGSSTDLTYHADLPRADQDRLSDGSKGFQQQQAFIQFGVGANGKDQRTWAEVYQNSGQTLVCRWDGTVVPKTATRPPITGLQAPSLMIAKICDD